MPIYGGFTLNPLESQELFTCQYFHLPAPTPIFSLSICLRLGLEPIQTCAYFTHFCGFPYLFCFLDYFFPVCGDIRSFFSDFLYVAPLAPIIFPLFPLLSDFHDIRGFFSEGNYSEGKRSSFWGKEWLVVMPVLRNTRYKTSAEVISFLKSSLLYPSNMTFYTLLT